MGFGAKAGLVSRNFTRLAAASTSWPNVTFDDNTILHKEAP